MIRRARIVVCGFIMLSMTTLPSTTSKAQQKLADSLVIKVGEGSKIVFSIVDRKDLDILKHYDFQALMNDMITKLEKNDSTALGKPSSDYLVDSSESPATDDNDQEVETLDDHTSRDTQYDRDNDREDHVYHYGTRDWSNRRSSYRSKRTYHSISFDLGTNNYLSNGKFPDASNQYNVKPFGSWFVGVNSVQRTRLASVLFLEWGLGVSWYNFKFEDASTALTRSNTGVTFGQDLRDFDFMKSKLTASYINASIVPVLDLGRNRRKPMLFDNDHSDSFRIGIGPYAGYRIASHTKTLYKDNGDRNKDHNHDNFYLNNVRYGARLQVGFRDVDLFFNYDMNELFASGKGPSLNAFSFGVTF